MAYLLDTNILSELMKPKPDRLVEQWIDQQIQSTLFLSAITVSEMLYGIAKMPYGKRKAIFSDEVQAMFEHDFKNRIFPFTHTTAKYYAQAVHERTTQGLPIKHPDAQIASIALEHGLALVTRNTKDFECITELKLFNPFSHY